MWIEASNVRVAVSTERALRLRGARGASLRAVDGTVWITIDHDIRDIVLVPGDVFTIDSPEDVMVLAIKGRSARLAVCAPGRGGPAVVSPGAAVVPGA